jgi:hypothetical protein
VSVEEARRDRRAMIKRFLAAVESRMKAMEAEANLD